MPAKKGTPREDSKRKKDAASLAGTSAETLGKVALSTVLATSLSGALSQMPNTDMMSLPEPTPIVQTLEEQAEDPPAPKADEIDETTARRMRLRRLLRALLVALILVLSLALALTRGCASCVAAIPPAQEEEQEQKS